MALHRRIVSGLLLCCCATGSAWADGVLPAWGSRERQFLDVAEVFKLEPVQRQGDGFAAVGHIADGYYVYRHSIKAVDAQGRAVQLSLPAATAKHDEFFGDTEIYTGDALRLRFPATVTGPLTLHWQGCAEAGICYPPQTINVGLPAAAKGTPAAGDRSALGSPTAVPAAPGSAGAATGITEDQAAARRLAALGTIVAPGSTQRRDLRVVGEIDARAFRDRLDTAGAG